MKWNSKCFSEALVLLLIPLGLPTSPARAQSGTGTGTGTGTGNGIGYGMGMGYGMGLGFGMGLGGFRYAPSPTDYLNQRASLNAARRPAPATQGSMAGNPNAYYNKVRDDSFESRSDSQVHRSQAQRRQPSSLSGGQDHRQPAADRTMAASKSRQVRPLTDFVDSSGKLVWPGEAPAEVGLTEKREIFERARLAVLEEAREHGSASIETVTAARQKLLDYGRPALQQLRSSSTPRAADKFHIFLLSVYDSLGRSSAQPELTPGLESKP
jgi:hypothetical protein